jgi:hypothetical protein
MLMPSDAELGARVSELEATEPGAIVTERGVLAGVVLARNCNALILKGCSSVVLKAAPPVMLSAMKITFCPLPGKFVTAADPARLLEKLVLSGPVRTVLQAVVLAPPFQ